MIEHKNSQLGYSSQNESNAHNQGSKAAKNTSNQIEIPSITLPKGGGALKGIDEKFTVNAANGTSSFSLPLPFSKSRSAFGPSLTLSYSSGAGNSAFGLGWSCDVPSIQRKTDKKLPQYRDEEESDVFLFSGAEDLVPVLIQDEDGNWNADQLSATTGEKVKRYRPRTEGLFARIEKIKTRADQCFYWKVTTKDNVVTFFGRTEAGRIADPFDSSKVFKWLPDLSFDDKGNCMQFEYVSEDLKNTASEIHEKNRRNELAAFTNKYLKRIKYGNKNPYYFDKLKPYTPENPANPEYFFEAVFDYSDHDESTPTSEVQREWGSRTDAFSHCRAGFEIRTYRLCRRVLFFHYFTELSPAKIFEATLVRSLNLNYKYFQHSDESYTEADFITYIQQYGYARNDAGGYDSKSLPALEFTYNELEWSTEVNNASEENFTHTPAGMDSNHQWMDFYGEGISGILHETTGAWYYKSNLGDGNFSIAQPVASKPSFNGLSGGLLQLQDIEANGKKYIVSVDTALKGFFEQTDEGDWLPFKSFESAVNIDLRDPNVKFIDLNGDGMAELIMSEENVFTWFASKGTKGFEEAMRSMKPIDEETGPAIVFTDQTQSIYLADMNGDGLTDIVRIRNGEVCYWQNLGYGKFSAMVSMMNAPVFDSDEDFNPQYLHLFDVSGTGVTDIVYLGNNTFKAWINLSGNSWSLAKEIENFPATVIPNNVNVLDFLGNGTGCIVWSSPMPDNAQAPMRYIDLLGGKKPYIITSYANNFGKVTTVEYKSSTQFYLKDKIEGAPWITKLPFPVQCVSKLEVKDDITGVRFTNEYSYHHGYYDHFEREFRGFGRVDQTDTENFADYKKNTLPDGSTQIANEEFYQFPVRTKTWYHTGVFLDQESVLDQFAKEYFVNEAFEEYHLPQPDLPVEWSVKEWMEALRACKGMVLRQEVYALDESEKEAYPYSVAEHNCNIQRLQPVEENANAVFLVTENEAITYNYERNPGDPRIAHSLNLQIDEYGNIRESAAVVYGRKKTDTDLPVNIQAAQNKIHIICTQVNFTNDIIEASAYRLRTACEMVAHELTGISPAAAYFNIEELKSAVETTNEIGYEEIADVSFKQKRRIEHERTLFLDDAVAEDVLTILPLYSQRALGLKYESYRLAFTDGLLNNLLGAKATDDVMAEAGLTLSNDYKSAGYFPATDDDNEWWIRSGNVGYPSSPTDHFFLPEKYIDPMGSETSVAFYADYHLMIQSTEDAIGNTVKVEAFDFRTLSPQKMMDINGSYSEVAIDLLGLVVGMAAAGKLGEGDNLDGFKANLSQEEIDDYFNDPASKAINALGNATSRFIYDFTRTNVSTAVVSTITREKHLHQLEKDETSPVQLSFEYSDGFGKVVMKKVQAEPGMAKQLDESNNVTEVDTSPKLRWIGNGRTILNNKGKPVKQFEPYFSVTHKYESESALVEIGVTPVMYYDPIGRLIKTELPDGTFSKVEFDGWYQKTYDGNDTVKDSKWYIEKSAGTTEEKDAANKSIVHYNTPSTAHLDSLGRAFYTIAHNTWTDRETGETREAFYTALTELDIESNPRKLIDARNNTVMEYHYDMLGNVVYQQSMDAGERCLLNDVLNNPLYKWDAKETVFHFKYDVLHRPIALEVTEKDKTVLVCSRSEYGESHASDVNYLKGKIYKSYDGSGIVTSEDYDFKGNLLKGSRQLTEEYKQTIDWTDIDAVVLRADKFMTETEYDAINRPLKITTPDKSEFIPTFNEAALLETMKVNIRGTTVHDFVTNINYNEKGQRTEIFYGNGTKTTYNYDEKTFRITRILTTRNAGEILQDLNYTYDPVGNITQIRDDAQATIFFNNAVVEANGDYTYDAAYRLIKATGREHAAGDQPLNEYDHHRLFKTVLPEDGSAMQNYRQYYEYDAVGNMLSMIHNAGVGSFTNRWTRSFEYEAGNNRLKTTQVGSELPQSFAFDVHGNMLTLPHLNALDWDFKDQLQSIERSSSNTETDFNTAYYTYDGGGNRVRKVITHANGVTEERLYLGAVEIFTQTSGTSVSVSRETLHVMDDKRRIAMVDTKTIEDDIEVEESLMRYQYDNHLGTACIELDDEAKVISYEEYYPFGSTAYQATTSEKEVPENRYHYTGKERDEESGLYYHGARYYAPWLARWTAADPMAVKDGWNVFQFCLNCPIKYYDPSGEGSTEASTKTNPSYQSLGAYSNLQEWLQTFGYLKEGGQVNLDDGTVVYRDNASGKLGYVPSTAFLDAWKKEIEYRKAQLEHLTNEPALGGGFAVSIGEDGSEIGPSDFTPVGDLDTILEGVSKGSLSTVVIGAASLALPGTLPSGVLKAETKTVLEVGEKKALGLAKAKLVEQEGGLSLAAQMAHDPMGTAYPMGSGSFRGTPGPGVSNKAVAIARVRLPDGTITYYASGSGATLSPAARQALQDAGVPVTNILFGSAVQIEGVKMLENHAEQVILRNLPEGSEVLGWGISWKQNMVGAPCVSCASSGVDPALVETEEQAARLLGLQ